MIIELHDDISQILDNITDPNDDNSLGINKLFELMYEYKHIIYASRQLLDRIKKFQFINPANKSLIVYLLNHYIDIYSSMPKVNKTLIVVPSKSYFSARDSQYYITLDNSHNLTQAKFSAENPKDYNFYINIFNFFNTNSFYTINLENCSFAGSTAKEFLEVLDRDYNIVLAISDSDKNYKTDDLGDTAKIVKRFVDRHSGTSIMDYYILGVREKENLIPIDCYNLFSTKDNKTFLECINKCCSKIEFMKFVDIKDGYKLKHISAEDGYWHSLYDGFIHICKQNGICNMDVTEDDKNCINGIGKNLADKICNIFFCKTYKKSPTETKIIESAKFDVMEHIPSYIMDEYQVICSVLFDYGCAQRKKHNSFI